MYRTMWRIDYDISLSDIEWLRKHCDSLNVHEAEYVDISTTSGRSKLFLARPPMARFETTDPKIEMLIPLRFPNAYVEYKEGSYDETDTIYRGL